MTDHQDSDRAEVGIEIERRVQQAIADAVASVEGGFASKWVAVVETIGPNGEAGLWSLTSAGLTRWDGLGMMTWSLQMEQAAAIRDDE